MRSIAGLKDILDLPFDGLVSVFEFVGRKALRREYLHYELEHGINATLVIDRFGNLIGMRLSRNLDHFVKTGFGDTLHSIEVGYRDQWEKLSSAILNKSPSDLPFSFHWHKASDRAYQQEDGEIFTLGQEHVRAIQKIIDQVNRKG